MAGPPPRRAPRRRASYVYVPPAAPVSSSLESAPAAAAVVSNSPVARAQVMKDAKMQRKTGGGAPVPLRLLVWVSVRWSRIKK